MADNVQVLKDAYGAFARQDLAAVFAAFDEEIVWRSPDSLPFGGTFHGREEVQAFFASLPGYWQELSIEPQEFIESGDTVVVIVRDRAKGAGGPFDDETIHLWRMRDGKAVSFTEFLDTARSLRSLGLPIASGS